MAANLPLVSLVDDDATVRKALSRLIRSLAFECEDFASAEHIPIIIMTGFDEDGLQEKCLGAGAIDYLLKPLDGPTIASAIHRAQKANQTSKPR